MLPQQVRLAVAVEIARDGPVRIAARIPAVRDVRRGVGPVGEVESLDPGEGVGALVDRRIGAQVGHRDDVAGARDLEVGVGAAVARGVAAVAAGQAVVAEAADQDIVAAIALQDVVTAAAVDDVRRVVSDQRVGGEAAPQVLNVLEPVVTGARLLVSADAHIDGDGDVAGEVGRVVAGAAIDDVVAEPAIYQVVADLTADYVVAGIAVDRVVAVAAVDFVVVVAAVDLVVALIAVDEVEASPAERAIVTGAREQPVVVVLAEQRIVAVVAVDLVLAEAAGDVVVASVAVQLVVAVVALDRVGAVAAVDDVVGAKANEFVVAVHTVDAVGFGRSDDPVVAVRTRKIGHVAAPRRYEDDWQRRTYSNGRIREIALHGANSRISVASVRGATQCIPQTSVASFGRIRPYFRHNHIGSRAIRGRTWW